MAAPIERFRCGREFPMLRSGRPKRPKATKGGDDVLTARAPSQLVLLLRLLLLLCLLLLLHPLLMAALLLLVTTEEGSTEGPK